MKILSNAKYQAMKDQLKYRSESNVKLNRQVAQLNEELEVLKQERLRLNLTRDEKGVLHRIKETKTSRINRKAKADKESKNGVQNEPKQEKFEPKEGEICVLFGLLCGEIVCYFNNTESVFGINESGQFGSYWVSPKDTFSPATKSQKAKLQKLDPQSEYNLRKMIDSKSPKELATKYLGLKVGDGEICGYNNTYLIVGYDIPKKGERWTPNRFLGADKALVEHKFYSYQTKAAKASILKSLNPR